MREFLVTTIGGHMLTQDSDLTPSLPPFVTLVCKSHSPPFLNCEPICWTSNISCDQWACHIVGLFSSRKIYSLQSQYRSSHCNCIYFLLTSSQYLRNIPQHSPLLDLPLRNLNSPFSSPPSETPQLLPLLSSFSHSAGLLLTSFI